MPGSERVDACVLRVRNRERSLVRRLYRVLASLGLLFASTVAVLAFVKASRGGLENVYLHSASVGSGQPVYLQYFVWLFRVLQGDLGWSTTNAEPVSQAITDRLPASIELALFAFVAAIVLGAAIGYGRARARGSAWRGILAILQLTGRAMPLVVLAFLSNCWESSCFGYQRQVCLPATPSIRSTGSGI